MDMNPDNPRLIVPGPGGVEFQCSPGIVVYPLEPTHSGHLLMPCSEFNRRPGEETITLVSGVHEASSVQEAGTRGSQMAAAATQTAGVQAASPDDRASPL